MVPMGLSHYALAKAIGVPPQRVLEIVPGRRAVTGDTRCASAAISASSRSSG